MFRPIAIALLAGAAFDGCNEQPQQKQTPIKVTGPEQQACINSMPSISPLP